MSTGASRPLVFAHRGSSGALPEHTLAAYLRALAEGADGLECDVRLTRDGHLVCVHDRRLNRTSNGRGRVSSHTLADLNALDFGSWHQRGAPGASGPLVPAAPSDDPPDPDRVRLLTLARLLDAVRDAGRDVRLLIETKHPSRYGAEVERRLIAMLRRYGLDAPVPDDPVRVTVMSFSPLAIRVVSQLAPTLPTALLLDVLPPGLRLGRLPFGAVVAAPSIGLVRSRPGLLAGLRDAGHQVYVWTVNELNDLNRVVAGGAHGVITDHPGRVLAHLAG